MELRVSHPKALKTLGRDQDLRDGKSGTNSISIAFTTALDGPQNLPAVLHSPLDRSREVNGSRFAVLWNNLARSPRMPLNHCVLQDLKAVMGV